MDHEGAPAALPLFVVFLVVNAVNIPLVEEAGLAPSAAAVTSLMVTNFVGLHKLRAPSSRDF